MSEYLNKWFWIKDQNGILNAQERELWYPHGWNSLQCTEEKKDALTLFYASENIIIHAKKDCVEERPAPTFLYGDSVLIIKKQNKASVKYAVWHYNDQYYYYMLADENGKPLKKRYMADELEKLEAVK